VALDPSFAGRRLPPTEPYLVSREKIREFAEAIGADDAAYRDPAAAAKLGYTEVIAPPTFPMVVAGLVSQALYADPDLGLDFSRVVHADQRFAYVRPVRAGDRLVCVCEVEAIMSRGGNEFLTTRIDMATDAGEPVVSVWSRLVVRA